MSSPPIATASTGFGVQGAGSTPAGLGTPAAVAALPNGSAGSRYINPATGDYEIDPATGQFAQMPPVRQQVLLALATTFSSATAIPEFGIRAPRKIGDNYVAENTAAARYALRHLTREDAPVIRIEAVLVKRTRSSRIRLTVAYTDLTTGKNDSGTVYR